MSTQRGQSTPAPIVDDGRYEFRTWGEIGDAFEVLRGLADELRCEQVDDWYLAIGRADRNVKIRRDRLKIKRLVGEVGSFQRWTSSRRPLTGEGIDISAVLVEELGMADVAVDVLADLPAGDRLPAEIVARIPGLEAIHVRKWRRCFAVGDVRAEVAEMEVAGRPNRLTSIAIEGFDLFELSELRSRLGFDRRPNVGVHQAIAGD